MQHSPPGAQQYNGVVENAIQRSNKSPWRLAAPRSGAWGRGVSRVFAAWMLAGTSSGRNRRTMPQKLNQAASPSNPGRASPQELLTGKKSAFLVVPFFQYGFMYREGRSKLDDKAVPCYFLCLLYTSPSPRDS